MTFFECGLETMEQTTIISTLDEAVKGCYSENVQHQFQSVTYLRELLSTDLQRNVAWTVSNLARGNR